jgi:hypothetical protein
MRFAGPASVCASRKVHANTVNYPSSEMRRDLTKGPMSGDEAILSGTHTASAAKVSRAGILMADSPVCGLALYKHDHLLCPKGHPYCPSCYESTVGASEIQDPPTETHTANTTRDIRPAPPSRRRFAAPGSVIAQAPQLVSSNATSQSIRSTTSVKPASFRPPAPLQDHRHANNRDEHTHHLDTPRMDIRSGQPKDTQGLYRDTVRNLAKRFESL